MADRAGGEGDPGVPKEVFELDKDERWQARLDEARARREIALREKAAGRPQKPRPKPWEIEGASVEKPPEIEPVIQERGDDKFDFADRLETIREAKEAAAPPKAKPRAPTPVPDVAEPPAVRKAPEPVPPARPTAARAPAPEPRARPQPSLILPGAPDVADLAARYAATLDSADSVMARKPEPIRDDYEDDSEQVERTADLVALPTAARRVETPEPDKPMTRAERRRGIRPLGMAFALLALAVLPLTTEAPPLETGPAMPVVDVLRVQPALGVTWSLYEPPFMTRPGEWVPGAAPPPLSAVPFVPPVSVLNRISVPPEPGLRQGGAIEWSAATPVARPAAPDLAVPAEADGTVPVVGSAPQPANAPVDTARETDSSEPTGAVSAPPRPATLRDESSADAPPPAARQEPVSDSVVEVDPLRVTVLAPARVDRALADTIAASVANDGHELVRIRDVDFSISERNLRYFHEEDRAAAARMAERYDAELRDFTWFRPQPVEGTAELWLAGRAATSNTSGRTQSVQSGGSTVDQGDFLGRVFDRLGLGTELPEALPEANDLRSILPNSERIGN